MMFTNGLVIVPMYSICAIANNKSLASKRFFKASRRVNMESQMRHKALLAKLQEDDTDESDTEDNKIDLDLCRKILLESKGTGKMDAEAFLSSLFSRMGSPLYPRIGIAP